MARITYVGKAQKSKKDRRCCKCSKPIEVGDSYKWFATRIGTMSIRKNFCSACPIRQSDQTTSDKLGQLYSAIENAEDALGDLQGQENPEWGLDSVSAILEECAQEVRTVSEEYGESADNMEDAFGHETSTSAEVREKAETLEAFADELESEAGDIDGLDDPAEETVSILTEFDGEVDDEGEPVDSDEAEQFVADKRDERRQAAIDQAEAALCNCPM